MNFFVDPKGDWTQERIELLTSLWTTNLSTSEIAGAIGRVTKNGVIGKARRIGLPKKKSAARGQRAPRPKPQLAPKPEIEPNPPGQPLAEVRISLNGRIKPAAQPVKLPPSEKQDDEAASIATSQRKTLFELTNETCRWPMGHPNTKGFFFCGFAGGKDCRCGADFINGRPYCSVHAARATLGIPVRRNGGFYVNRKAQPERRDENGTTQRQQEQADIGRGEGDSSGGGRGRSRVDRGGEGSERGGAEACKGAEAGRSRTEQRPARTTIPPSQQGLRQGSDSKEDRGRWVQERLQAGEERDGR